MRNRSLKKKERNLKFPAPSRIPPGTVQGGGRLNSIKNFGAGTTNLKILSARQGTHDKIYDVKKTSFKNLFCVTVPKHI